MYFRDYALQALGSIVFIHKGCTDIAQYDFVRKVFSPVLVREDTELVDDGLENERRTRKHKFPKHFWPAIKWGRKGYLQMRWKLGTWSISAFHCQTLDA